MTKITLDAEVFKVLASDTRLQILKSLDERPKTVSELGRELDLNKATVHEHLQQLLSGELIKKNEREGRKWVYYQLSWKGKSLLHPENTTVMILLGLAALGSAGAIVQLGNWLRWWGMSNIFGVGGESEDAGADGDMESLKAPADDQRSEDTAAGSSRESDQPAQQFAMDAGQNETDGGEADADGGAWYDFLGDGDFWLFAVLFLVATAAVVGAMLVKQQARDRVLEGSREVEPAEIGPVKGGEED